MTRHACPLLLAGAAWIVASVAHGQPAPSTEDVTAASCASAHRDAQVARRDGRLLESKRQLIACSRSACPTLITDDCRPWLDELERLIPVLTVEVVRGGAPVKATIVVDGEERRGAGTEHVIPLDPGEHELRVEAPGSATVVRQLRVEGGVSPPPLVIELDAIVPDPAPAPGPTPQPDAAEIDEDPSVATWIVGGAGLVGLGLFAGFGASGLSRRGALDDSGCAPRCDPGEVDAMERDFLVADVALGAGLGLLGVATVLFFATRSTTSATSARAVVTASPEGLTVTF